MPSLHHVNADKPTLSGAGAGMVGAYPVGAERTAAPLLLTFAWLLTACLVPEPVRLSVIQVLQVNLARRPWTIRRQWAPLPHSRSVRKGFRPVRASAVDVSWVSRAGIIHQRHMLASRWRQVIAHQYSMYRGHCCHCFYTLRGR
ncbi:hypothetical protein M440DRAFT_241744 [Trichoderma longibrachiatum ATCC 18648]|uniref:Uncharacterized protein n=1 Tax=Trichoderma longibrachiatum ATCC 18648 TaxID=983965 RepID=A0A2T4CDG2_TRILO|nr:hypothetical protein M440DRAFT_241744 [Trichoderma longibrachiatum ATCC 18648]